MGNVFNSVRFNNVCIYFVLVTFPVASIALPVPTRQLSNAENQLDNDASVIVDRIFDKLLKLEKKGKVNEMIDFMLDVRDESESHLGYSISIKDQLKEVQKLAREEGKEISEKQIEAFKKILKKREKKHNKIVMGVTFRSKKNQENEEEKEEIEFRLEWPLVLQLHFLVHLYGSCRIPQQRLQVIL